MQHYIMHFASFHSCKGIFISGAKLILIEVKLLHNYIFDLHISMYESFWFYTNAKIMKPLITIISASSIMVTVLMGKLKTAPKQAH